MPLKNHFLLQPLQFCIVYIAHAHTSSPLWLSRNNKRKYQQVVAEQAAQRAGKKIKKKINNKMGNK